MKLDTCQTKWSSLIKTKTERSSSLISNRRKRSFPQNDMEPVRGVQSGYSPLPMDPFYDSQFYHSYRGGVKCGREVTPDDHTVCFTATPPNQPDLQMRCTRAVANDSFMLQNVAAMQPPMCVVSTQPPNPMSVMYTPGYGALPTSSSIPSSFLPYGFLEQLEK